MIKWPEDGADANEPALSTYKRKAIFSDEVTQPSQVERITASLTSEIFWKLDFVKKLVELSPVLNSQCKEYWLLGKTPFGPHQF